MSRIESSGASEARQPVNSPPTVRAEDKAAARPVVAADRLKLSTGEKLKEGNKRALKQAGQSAVNLIAHPIQTIKGMASSLVTIVGKPHLVVDSLKAAYARDPIDGVIQSAMIGASVVGLAAVATMGLAYGGALLTGGASLAILPAAGLVASIAGVMGVVGMGASFVKNQFDVAGAETEGELQRESAELGQDYTNMGFAVATTAASKGLGYAAKKLKPQNVNPSAAQRAAYRVKAQLQGKRPSAFESTSAGGLKVDGKPRDWFRETAVREVQGAMDDSVQGVRTVKVQDLDATDFRGVERLGEHRMVYHGTRAEVAPLIRENGLRTSHIGDYGAGQYFGSSAKIGVGYADDVTLGRATPGQNPVVFVGELAPGKVLDFFAHKNEFLAWAKQRFDPTDMTQTINQLYADPSVPVSKMVDNTWTRYLPQYCQEMGYDSILIRDWDGPGLDYWVVHDPKRVVLRQEVTLGAPENRFLVPPSFDGRILGTVQATKPEKER